MFTTSRHFVIAQPVVMKILRQEDVDVDPRLINSIAGALHGFIEALVQQFLSTADTHAHTFHINDGDFMNEIEVREGKSA